MFISSNAWNQTFEEVSHDVYHRYEYVAADSLSFSPAASPLLYSVENLALPLVARKIDSNTWDATSPYGYGSPISLSPHMQSISERALQTAIRDLGDSGCVSLFLRLHPFIPFEFPEIENLDLDSPVPTVWINLENDSDIRFKEMRPGFRRDIQNAKNAGISITHDKHLRYLDQFIDAYTDTMSRHEAQKKYFFTREYFVRLLVAMPEHVSLLVATKNGEFAAGAMVTHVGKIGQYHLAATNSHFLGSNAMKVLVFEAASYLQTKSCSIFHLGGGLGGSDDSLFKFKAGFSDSRASFQTARIICNPDEYNRLVSERPNDAPDTSFFPAYRAPM